MSGCLRMTGLDGGAVAIVSGGCCGAGREVARRLAAASYWVVVVYLEDQGGAEAAVEEIVAAGGTAVAVRADLTDELDVERLFTETVAAFGGVDAFVHTTTRAAPALYQHAARRLRRGGAIVSAFATDGITPQVAERLRERDVTVNGVPPGLEPPGGAHDAGELLALLERWRRRPDD